MVSVEKSEVVPERLESAENIKLERLVKAARKQAKLRDGEARKVKGLEEKTATATGGRPTTQSDLQEALQETPRRLRSRTKTKTWKNCAV